MARYVLGDVHSDYGALKDWLRKIRYNPDADQIYSLGDLADRGNSAKAVYDTAMKYGWGAVKSNHGHKLGRYGLGNPVQMNPELQDTINQLGPDWQKYAQWKTICHIIYL